MKSTYNQAYPSIQDLRLRAQKRMPKFAFQYLDGGCNDEYNLRKNSEDFQEIAFQPQYLVNYEGADLKCELFGKIYNAPFGIAPVGLQGLMWPNSPEILAKAAVEANIPFVLSTVSTSSIERISQVTAGKFWFQLYHPKEDRLRDDLLKRARQGGCDTLVVLADTPTFGLRYKDMKNGLAMPPRMTLNNIVQMLKNPAWFLQTLRYGKPEFECVKPYLPKGLSMKQLGQFMNDTFEGRLNEKKISKIRDLWKAKLVVKGVVSDEDFQLCKKLGVDGIIVSNHGGRQLDAGLSSIKSLQNLVSKNKGQMAIMLDGGMRSGVDIARAYGVGADFVFLGRAFMYSVGALGRCGGENAINMLKAQLGQVMEQVACHKVEQFRTRVI